MSDFSQLPYDVLQLIANSLTLSDYYRFGAVCRFWQSVVKAKRITPASKLPWLLLSDNTSTPKRSLFSWVEQKHYYMNIPELAGRRCCGSSHGWLITVNDELEYNLFNPFTRATIQLPPILRYDEYGDTKCLDYTPEERLKVRNGLMHKAILSADPSTCSDYVVMALVSNKRRLAFWRPNDLEWTEMENNIYSPHEDVIWYKGHFYVITFCNTVIVFDVDPRPRARLFYPRFLHINLCEGGAYLVDMMGDLILVVRKIYDERFHGDADDVEDEKCLIETTEFRIWKLDVSTSKWIELAGIGDCALFLGFNNSMAVRASEFPDCRKNCIYFTDNYTQGPFLYGDMGIYSLSDKSIEPFYPKPSRSLLPAVSPPIWLNQPVHTA